MILLRLANPPNLAGRRALALLAQQLLAIILFNITRKIPAARFTHRPAQLFVDPIFEEIGIQNQDRHPGLGNSAALVDLDRAAADRRAHLPRTASTGFHVMKPPTKIINPM